MKRIHLVGKSDDQKSLIFAATKGGKRGSFEVPITKKLRELVAENDTSSARKGEEQSPVPGRDHVRVLPTPTPAPQSASGPGKTRGLPPGAFERATGFGGGIPELRGVRALIGGGEEASSSRRGGLAAVPEPVGETADENREPPTVETRDVIPQARGRQTMSAGEIQALLRAGRGVRSVAKAAGANLDWVTRLDETIQMERIAVVRQLLGAYLTRDRLGESEAPVAEAILQNLRKRRVRSPERVLAAGWSASRPRGKEWRVRFVYRYRDKSRRADWSYDPRTGDVQALNDAGAELAWVPPRDPGGRSGRRGRDPGRLKRRP